MTTATTGPGATPTPAELVIHVRSVGPGLYEASLDGEVLCQRREPFLAAARVLQARGVPPDTPIAQQNEDEPYASLRSTVGKAAALRVTEDHGMPRFSKFRPGRDKDD